MRLLINRPFVSELKGVTFACCLVDILLIHSGMVVYTLQ